MIRNISYKKRRNSRALAKIFEKSAILLYTTYYDSGGVSFKVSAKYTNKDGFTMALLETWRKLAYETEMDQKNASEFWGSYFNQEKAIYEQILADSDTVVKGTVKELAEKFGVEVLLMTGFLDGINDSLKTPNLIETMDENTEVSLDYDKEKLYYNMVGCKADWLYELPQWDNLLDEQTRKDLYKKQKLSGTVVKGKKIGRNDPCPCGSGKKYKQCCGKNA